MFRPTEIVIGAGAMVLGMSEADTHPLTDRRRPPPPIDPSIGQFADGCSRRAGPICTDDKLDGATTIRFGKLCFRQDKVSEPIAGASSAAGRT